MPLIRRGSTPGPPPAAPSQNIDPSRLVSGSTAERWTAARLLGDDPAGAPKLISALAGESEPEVRDAIFTSLVLIRSPDAAAGLAGIVQSDDAQLRAGALDGP